MAICTPRRRLLTTSHGTRERPAAPRCRTFRRSPVGVVTTASPIRSAPSGRRAAWTMTVIGCATATRRALSRGNCRETRMRCRKAARRRLGTPSHNADNRHYVKSDEPRGSPRAPSRPYVPRRHLAHHGHVRCTPARLLSRAAATPAAAPRSARPPGPTRISSGTAGFPDPGAFRRTPARTIDSWWKVEPFPTWSLQLSRCT